MWVSFLQEKMGKVKKGDARSGGEVQQGRSGLRDKVKANTFDKLPKEVTSSSS